MTIHILNSAVMPQPGIYEIEQLTKDEFSHLLRQDSKSFDFKHYIGYGSTLQLLMQLTGIDFGRVNKNKTVLEDGDIFYVVRLNYRVDHNDKKGRIPDVNDFEYFRGTYEDLRT